MSRISQSSRHHYVPASYIGRFSWTSDGKRYRERQVWVARSGVSKLFTAAAQKRAFKNGLYDLPNTDDCLGGHIDRWAYEATLPAVLNKLAHAETLTAESWLYTLVPFVAGLFVRSPDANDGVNNDGRFIEFQEMLAPVMAARWTVLHFPAGIELTTNDRGVAVVTYEHEQAVFVPIDPENALVLRARDRQVVRRREVHGWLAPIEHHQGSTADVDAFRVAVARDALHEIYGPSEVAVTGVQDQLMEPRGSFPQRVLAPGHVDLRCHFYDYFRACAVVNATPGLEQAASDEAKWSDVRIDPDTPVAIELLFPERTRGGVYANSCVMVIDLEFGRVVKEIRQLYGDWRAGASATGTPRRLEPTLPGLGQHWLRGRFGESGHTTVHSGGPGGREITFDLKLLWDDNRLRRQARS